MNITAFGQIIRRFDRFSFKNIVEKYDTDKHNKGINSWTHMVSMVFCHIAKANSLREISNGIRSASGNLNHLGITKVPANHLCPISTNIVTGGYLEITILLCSHHFLKKFLFNESNLKQRSRKYSFWMLQ